MISYINFGTGAFYIFLGFMIRRFPMLIAGYNTMTLEQRANVDEKRLAIYMRNWFVRMGMALILGDLLVHWLNWTDLTTIMIFIVTLPGVAIILVGAQKYNHNIQNRTNLSFGITVIIVVSCLVVGLFYYGIKMPGINVIKGQLAVTGMYGLVADVQSIEISETLPNLISRTNGFAAMGVRMGEFQSTEGKVTLFLFADEGPFIKVVTTDNQTIFINTKYEWQTNTLLDRMKAGLE